MNLLRIDSLQTLQGVFLFKSEIVATSPVPNAKTLTINKTFQSIREFPYNQIHFCTLSYHNI